MEEVIINKVAESALTTIDLADYYPAEQELALFDVKPFLFMELILREKDFREALKNHDWTVYEGKQVAVTCSADAIIPVWAYMLAAAYLTPVAAQVYMTPFENLANAVLVDRIKHIDVSVFTDKRIVVKGCGELPISEAAYLTITAKLRPVVKSIMYGEPCSTVPIYKNKG
jgi:hypothetical protein